MSEATPKEAGALEKSLLGAFRALSMECQQEVLDFAGFLLDRQGIERVEDEDYDCEDLTNAIVEGLRAVKEGSTHSWEELMDEL